MVNSQYYPEISVWLSTKLDYLTKMMLRQVAGGSFQVSKIKISVSIRLKYDFKWWQGSTIDDTWCQQSFFN